MSAPLSPSAVRAVIVMTLPGHYPTLDDVAGVLGVSSRTLQRRLSDEGLAYFDLVEQSRLEIASRLLEDPTIPIRDISVEVGFADPSSFSRFFRRFTGMAPKTFRRQRSIGGANIRGS